MANTTRKALVELIEDAKDALEYTLDYDGPPECFDRDRLEVLRGRLVDVVNGGLESSGHDDVYRATGRATTRIIDIGKILSEESDDG